MQYVIVGDTKKYKDCLVYVIRGNRELAEQVLDRMLNNPDQHDLKSMEGHTNFRIEEVEDRNAWWNDPFLMSD